MKRIPVAFFRDDSFDDKKIMTGYGLDGVLYTFVVTPKTAIPYFRKLTDEISQRKSTDGDLTAPSFIRLLYWVRGFGYYKKWTRTR